MIWWIIGLVLVAVAAASIWFAFRSPAFVSGLAAIGVAAFWRMVKPQIGKRMTTAEEAEKNEAERRGQGDEWLRKRNGSLRPDR